MGKPYYYEMYKRIQDNDFELYYTVTYTDIDYDFYRKILAARVFATSDDGLICIYTEGRECFYPLNKEDSLLIILKAKNIDNTTIHFDPGHA